MVDNENDIHVNDRAARLVDKLPDIDEISLWKLVILTLLFPPLGTLAIAISNNAPRWVIAAAAVYTAAVTVALLAHEGACLSTAVVSASDIMTYLPFSLAAMIFAHL